jgi:hypothetical protein
MSYECVRSLDAWMEVIYIAFMVCTYSTTPKPVVLPILLPPLALEFLAPQRYVAMPVNRSLMTQLTQENVFHKRMVPSSDPVAYVFPSGAYLKHRMGP